MSDTTRTGLAAEPHSRTAEGKARPALNNLKHGRFSRHGSLLQYECDRAISAPVLPSRITLRTHNIDRKLPSGLPQPIHSKRRNFGSNLGSNPFRTPAEPPSDPERTPSEPHSDPIRTTPDTPSNSRGRSRPKGRSGRSDQSQTSPSPYPRIPAPRCLLRSPRRKNRRAGRSQTRPTPENPPKRARTSPENPPFRGGARSVPLKDPVLPPRQMPRVPAAYPFRYLGCMEPAFEIRDADEGEGRFTTPTSSRRHPLFSNTPEPIPGWCRCTTSGTEEPLAAIGKNRKNHGRN